MTIISYEPSDEKKSKSLISWAIIADAIVSITLSIIG
jgi:hypothetical protein